MSERNQGPSVYDLAGGSHSLKSAIEYTKANLSLLCDAAQITAKIRKASFDAHIKQGFTHDQAIALCLYPFDSKRDGER